jgi:triacylglycerol lipase
MKCIKLAAMGLLLSCISAGASASWFSSLFHDTYTKTHYPIVLVNGLFGFDNLLGVDYFYQVPQELRRSGAQVFVAQVAAANSTEIRGEELARQVEAILAATGAHKVNLIGHSHGGPTIRYVASVYPQYVASATSVGGVNWGSKDADVIEGVVDQSTLAKGVVETLGNGLASLIDLLSSGGYSQDILAALHDLTTPATVAFNAKYPEGMPSQYCGAGQEIGNNGVYYFSWGGAAQVTTGIDPSDYLLAATSIVFNEKNDGLVSSCSSHLGHIIRDDYHMNHLDEVNQLIGVVDAFSTNPVTVYRAQANRLKNLGL